jgi:hypothetical protein
MAPTSYNGAGKMCTHLVPWTSFDLRKLEFCVVGIHTPDFLSRWSAQNLQEVYHWLNLESTKVNVKNPRS